MLSGDIAHVVNNNHYYYYASVSALASTSRKIKYGDELSYSMRRQFVLFIVVDPIENRGRVSVNLMVYDVC